ncbi:MAG TPA: hypothetical protein VIN61_13355 [Gammaproteobacteria bacterium]
MSRSVAEHGPIAERDVAGGPWLDEEWRMTERTDTIHRTPVVWLAAALVAASLAACIVTILLALGQPDDAALDAGERLLGVPAGHGEVDR